MRALFGCLPPSSCWQFCRNIWTRRVRSWRNAPPGAEANTQRDAAAPPLNPRQGASSGRGRRHARDPHLKISGLDLLREVFSPARAGRREGSVRPKLARSRRTSDRRAGDQLRRSTIRNPATHLRDVAAGGGIMLDERPISLPGTAKYASQSTHAPGPIKDAVHQLSIRIFCRFYTYCVERLVGSRRHYYGHWPSPGIGLHRPVRQESPNRRRGLPMSIR